jgi:hypothetical protein
MLTDSDPKLPLMDNGYIRLTKKYFQALKLQHLVSALYVTSKKSTIKVDTIDQIEGFTEWVSDTQPAVSLGWDWILDTNQNPPLYRRWGLPYSNIMLTDNLKADLDQVESERLIISAIDQLNWESVVFEFISKTYGYDVGCQH